MSEWISASKELPALGEVVDGWVVCLADKRDFYYPSIHRNYDGGWYANEDEALRTDLVVLKWQRISTPCLVDEIKRLQKLSPKNDTPEGDLLDALNHIQYEMESILHELEGE